MSQKQLLHKTFTNNPGTTDKDAIKDLKSRMATKDDLKDLEARIESKMATKDDLKDLEARIESKMATKTDLAKLESRMLKQQMVIAGIVIAALAIIL